MPSENLRIIVTIPCFNEPDLIGTLDSLHACQSTQGDVEVIVNVNSPEHASEEILTNNQKTIDDFNLWKQKNNSNHRKFYLICSPDLPKKHAGVGLARKIVMDEAAWRFCKMDYPEGVIVCLDADCTVERNYLSEMERHFKLHPEVTGCSIYFEHPLEGSDHHLKNYQSIINYELFLRYYVLSLKYSGFPYPFHTIGSSMAVRADAYMKQGGMNRRKAGEDFYFLHKIFPLGKFFILNTTRVIPSARVSDRVPFGTGADISKQFSNAGEDYTAYNPRSFDDLRLFFQIVPQLYIEPFQQLAENIPPSVLSFLRREGFDDKLKEFRKHTASQPAFVKRFFKWFNGFKVLKYVHFARDHFYPQIPIVEATTRLLERLGQQSFSASRRQLLMHVRNLERNNPTQ